MPDDAFTEDTQSVILQSIWVYSCRQDSASNKAWL